LQKVGRFAALALATSLLSEFVSGQPSNTSQSADTCGAVLLSEDFENYPGDWQPYTKALAQQDFGVLEKVGERKLNLIFLSGEERGAVGEGTLRSTQPKGVNCTLKNGSSCGYSC
jgi:hypothetical protein